MRIAKAVPILLIATGLGLSESAVAGLYSPLRQIDRTNISTIEPAWRYRTGELVRRGEQFAKSQSFEATPVLVDDALVFCTPASRIVALNPATGAERWVFDPNEKPHIAAPLPTCRGVSFWRDPESPPQAPCRTRILFGTWNLRIFAIDAKSGRRCAGFGANGMVDVLAQEPALKLGESAFVSPPAVVNGLAIFGSTIYDNRRHKAPSGKVRALDARTGALRWEFDPIAGEAQSGSANVWASMAVDAARGLVFLPTSSPSPDFFGGRRPGENRYADSLVALRAATGEIVWHFQITHHDLWDYDLPAQPILFELARDGQKIPAVLQLTKQGLIFVFHRETGAPLFPIAERAVPQGGVPGEWLAPTQPFPVSLPPLVAQGIWPKDAWGFTFLDRNACRRKIEALRHGPIYTPPSVQGTAHMPAFIGGVSWGGGAFDPSRQLLIVNTANVPGIIRLVSRGQKSVEGDKRSHKVTYPQLGTPYSAEYELLASPLGAPCTAPPWGRLTAVDFSAGTIRWQSPLGSLEKLLPLPIPLNLGTPTAGGALVTAGGVVFIGATLDDRFRAFDVETGKVVWQTKLPAGGQATPMSYMANGRQYVVIAAGGHALYDTTRGDYLMAFALPATALARN